MRARSRTAVGAKCQRISETLSTLYPDPPIPLAHTDPFTLLVAVILSAQTTDKKVNEVTPRLFSFAATPEAMAQSIEAEIEAAIRGVGLAPQKSKALVATARILVSEHQGRVPSAFDALIRLPGVGRKTANVVLSQAFNEAAFPVDTHVMRLAYRWGLTSAREPYGTERDLMRLFPREIWGRLHLQMISFGRTHCPALRHDFQGCPICSWAAPDRRIREESARRRRPTGKR